VKVSKPVSLASQNFVSRPRLEQDFPSGTAGAGSLILEFATLSRLTGDTRFEKAAHKAFFALWNRRSDIGLVGNTVNAWTGVRALSFEYLLYLPKFCGLELGLSRS
jgi:hypothetical protein